MSVKYEVLKKLVVAAGLKKRWISATTEELLENRRKQNKKELHPGSVYYLSGGFGHRGVDLYAV